MKRTLVFVIIGLMIVAGIVAAVLIVVSNNAKEAALNGPCGTAKVEAATKQIQNLLSRWADANQVAGSTPRIAMNGPMASMQSIKREMQELEVPDCMKNVVLNYSNGIDYGIQAYLTFMSQGEDTKIKNLFSSSMQSIKWGGDALAKVSACAPSCP